MMVSVALTVVQTQKEDGPQDTFCLRFFFSDKSGRTFTATAAYEGEAIILFEDMRNFRRNVLW